MSNTLIPVVFQHPQFGVIRVVPIGEKTWFVAKDVARTLDLRDANDLTRNIKKEYRGTQIVRTPSGDQQMQLINSSGLFQAVMSSRKPQAEPFQQWVLGDVLPSIAKDGEYRDLSNRMGETLARATDGAIGLPAERTDEGPMVEVSMKLLEALRHELVSSRIERRHMAQAFSKSLGQMVRVLGVQRMPRRGLDPNRPMSTEEITRAEFLFRSGYSGREVAQRLNRNRQVIADFMASRPDLLAEAIQASLI